MNRDKIIETYLELARKAHEVEYYWETGIATDPELAEANNTALEYYADNNITRQELTDYYDAKRNVVKCNNLDEAKQALSNFFS